MSEAVLKKILLSVLLLLAAVFSFLFLADRAAAPATHAETVGVIDEKTEDVLKLTASASLASFGVSAIPGDTATPIASKLADFSEYFLLILCVLYSEKYLIGIIGAGVFRVLIPCACALCIVSLWRHPRLFRRLAFKLAAVGLALYLIIPVVLILPHLFETPIWGVYLAQPTADLFAFSMALVLALTPLVVQMVVLTPEAQQYLTGMMIIMAVYMIGRCVNTVTINGVLDGGGDTVFDMYSLAVCMWGLAIPLALLGAFVFGWPVLAVYACTCLDEVGKIPWVMFRFRKYKWVKNLTREHPAD